MNLFEKVFGTHSERELKLIYPIVDKIVAMRPEMMALTDEQLRDRTRIFKERLANGETLDDIFQRKPAETISPKDTHSLHCDRNVHQLIFRLGRHCHHKLTAIRRPDCDVGALHIPFHKGIGIPSYRDLRAFQFHSSRLDHRPAFFAGRIIDHRNPGFQNPGFLPCDLFDGIA